MDDISQQMAEAANLDEDALEQEEEDQGNTEWPLLAKFYTHAGKEDNYETGRELGLRGQTLDDFRYTGYEVEFDIQISKDGGVVATHVNGMALVSPVKI